MCVVAIAGGSVTVGFGSHPLGPGPGTGTVVCKRLRLLRDAGDNTTVIARLLR